MTTTQRIPIGTNFFMLKNCIQDELPQPLGNAPGPHMPNGFVGYQGMPLPWGPMRYSPQYQMPPQYGMPWQQQQPTPTTPWTVATQPSPLTPGNHMPASPYTPPMHQAATHAEPSQTAPESVSEWCSRYHLTADEQAGLQRLGFVVGDKLDNVPDSMWEWAGLPFLRRMHILAAYQASQS